MASMFSFLCLFLTSLLTSLASADNVTFSSFVQTVNNDIYALAINVPSPALDNDLYFNFRGPSAASWVAFGLGGQGQHMDGALIFVCYLGLNGQNITVSPRLGTGHVQPEYTSDVKVKVMGDTHYESGDDGGYFVEFRCFNCRSWSGENSIDIDNTAQPMIYAMGPYGTFNSDDLGTTIDQHDFNSMGGFTLDLKQATGLGGLPSNSDLSNSDGSSGGNNHVSASVRFHALFTLSVFVFLLPAGYFALRVLEIVWMHWVIQSFGLFIIFVGCAAGIGISKHEQISPNLTHPHQIIGLVALFLVALTWATGLMGHLYFRKTKISRTTLPQKSHRILGPLAVVVGLANGILGFNFASNNEAIISYAMVVTLVTIFIWGLMIMKKRRAVRKNAMTTPAAHNFRQGQAEGVYVAPNDEAAVPLQNYQTEYSGASGNIGVVNGPPPTYYEAGGHYAPPQGRPM